nr:SDR family NAD(P)-dependent oxidoreductase [Arthrobacter sp. SDTb3-6]
MLPVNSAAAGSTPPSTTCPTAAGPNPAHWDAAEFDSALEVDLRGVFLCLKHQLRLMQHNADDGAIVNMSSTAGEQGVSGLAGHVAAKFGSRVVVLGAVRLCHRHRPARRPRPAFAIHGVRRS